MILSIANTEKNIVSALVSLNLRMDINAHPGDLDDRGIKARRQINAIVQFKDLKLDDAKINPKAPCFARQHTANYEILINVNSVRDHTIIYNLAETIAETLEGRCVLADRNDTLLNPQSPLYLSSLVFESFDETKSCHKMRLVISADFVDTYKKK